MTAAFDPTTGVRLYAPTRSKPSWRVVYRDPARAGRLVQLVRPDETDARLTYRDAVEGLTADRVSPAPRSSR